MLLRRVSIRCLVWRELSVLLCGMETSLLIPSLRWNVGTRKRMVSLRFGEVMRMIDVIEWRRLEGPLHLLLRRLYMCGSRRLRRNWR